MLNTQKFVEEIDAEMLRLKTLRASVLMSSGEKSSDGVRRMSPEGKAAIACATRLRCAVAQGDMKYAAKLRKELPILKAAVRAAKTNRAKGASHVG